MQDDLNLEREGAVAGPPASPARASLLRDTSPRPEAPQRMLGSRQKAAILVRYLLTQGENLPLTQLPEALQAVLAEEMGRMALVDRTTLDQVIDEFQSALDHVGLAFPGGLEGALAVMDGHISHATASRLRRKAVVRGDPWERLIALPIERLRPLLDNEAVEVCAVILSKLPVGRAAELLGALPGPRARRIAWAVSLTANVDPDTVRRIGQAVLAQLDAQPPRAFQHAPAERVGAILNVARANTRDDVLSSLEDEDAQFAAGVRRAILTWVHLPRRLLPRDVPRVMRAVAQEDLVTLVAWSAGRTDEEIASAFMLEHLSQRLADVLRDEAAQKPEVSDHEADAAMQRIISAIRALEAQGEIRLIHEDEPR